MGFFVTFNTYYSFNSLLNEPRHEKTSFVDDDADQLRGNRATDQRLCFHSIKYPIYAARKESGTRVKISNKSNFSN